MGRVIAVSNQKGGVGKTTTTVNLGAELAHSGRAVLILDFDPQGNATTNLGLHKETLTSTMYEAMMQRIPLQAAIQPTSYENLALAPVNMNMAGLQVQLVSEMQRESRLRQIVEPVRNQYDYIFIDCPPSLGLLTINAMVACDTVLVPLQCEFFAMEGVTQLMQTMQIVRRQFNPSLKLEGVLLTMMDRKTSLSKQVAEEARRYFQNDRVFESVIPRNVRLAEAPSFGQPISDFDRSSPGAKAYKKLAEEVLSSG